MARIGMMNADGSLFAVFGFGWDAKFRARNGSGDERGQFRVKRTVQRE